MKRTYRKVSLYDGTVSLSFNPSGHSYSVSTYGSPFTVVPSVTQALGIIDRSRGLVQWSADCAVASLREQIKPGVAYTHSQLAAAFLQARVAHRSTNGKALAVGTVVHKWLEGYLKRTKLLPLPRDPQANQACRAALEWMRSHAFQPKALEMLIYSRAHRYAGTTDALGGVATVGGKTVMVDWKTSRSVYPEHRCQLSAYAAAYEEMTGERVEDRWIVRLDKATGIPEAVCFTREEQGRDFEAFLAALNLWQAMKSLDGVRQYLSSTFD